MKSNVSAHPIVRQPKQPSGYLCRKFKAHELKGITTYEEFWHDYLGYDTEDAFVDAFNKMKFKDHEDFLRELQAVKPPKGKRKKKPVQVIPTTVESDSAEKLLESISDTVVQLLDEAEPESKFEIPMETEVESVIEVVAATEVVTDAMSEHTTEVTIDISTKASKKQLLQDEIASVDKEIQEQQQELDSWKGEVENENSKLQHISDAAELIRKKLSELLEDAKQAKTCIAQLETKISDGNDTIQKLLEKKAQLNSELEKMAVVRVLFSLEDEETLVNEEDAILLDDDLDRVYGLKEEDRYQHIPTILSVDVTLLQRGELIKKLANVLCLKNIISEGIMVVLENNDDYLTRILDILEIPYTVL